MRSYIIKKYTISKPNGERFTYLTPVNIILDNYLNKDASTCVESIKTILNHPHFKGCKDINDIIKKINHVNDLNKRYKKKGKKHIS